MSRHIALSLESALTAYTDLSSSISRTQERLESVTSPQAKAIYQDMLPALTAARDELARQLWPTLAIGGLPPERNWVPGYVVLKGDAA